MVKVALLIGVGKYGNGLSSLPAAPKDVEAMHEVLENPEIGGFDQVTQLIDPERQTMEEAIYALFINRKKDDLLLLFFSGHGVKDDTGNLYLAARNTRKEQEALVHPTAVAASYVQNIMSNSRSKRQVVILDCCFSGAFAEGMKAKEDGSVPVNQQLGGEGRAVLTSSTSTQYSFEHPGFDLSIYTHFLVEGIKTGIADRDKDGEVSVDELHEYAKEKVQETAPEKMKPEIYSVKEGFKILLAKVRVGDPKLKYRQEVELRIRDGKIPYVARHLLDLKRNRLGLLPEETVVIEAEVLKPYHEYEVNLQQYEQIFSGAIQQENPLNNFTRNDLKELQQYLGLKDTDVVLIETRITSQYPTSNHNPQSKPTVSIQDDLSSEREIDYTHLQDLLKAKQWKEADEETYTIMLKLAEKEGKLGFQIQDINRLPNRDIWTIDHLWVNFSNKVFGFSIQNLIYEDKDKDFTKFAEKVGWKKEKWLLYPEFISEDIPTGYLPASWLLASSMLSKKASLRGQWREDIFSSLMEKISSNDLYQIADVDNVTNQP